MSETVEITRYPNRRLYDRSQKRYVNTGDLESIILKGKNVRVLDSKSGNDITRLILTQIILERHPERMKMFPVAFLHEILRADQMSLDWFTLYFGQAKTLMQGLSAQGGVPNVPGLEFWRAMMPGSATGKSKRNEGETNDAEVGTEEPNLEDDPAQSGQEMADRLAELERRLQQLESEASADAKRGLAEPEADGDS